MGGSVFTIEAKFFSPRAKTKMLVMIVYIKEAFGRQIRALDLISAETKKKALVKLDKISVVSKTTLFVLEK